MAVTASSVTDAENRTIVEMMAKGTCAVRDPAGNLIRTLELR